MGGNVLFCSLYDEKTNRDAEKKERIVKQVERAPDAARYSVSLVSICIFIFQQETHHAANAEDDDDGGDHHHLPASRYYMMTVSSFIFCFFFLFFLSWR